MKIVDWIAQQQYSMCYDVCDICHTGYGRNGVGLPNGRYSFCAGKRQCWMAYLLTRCLARSNRPRARFETISELSHPEVCAWLVAYGRDAVAREETVGDSDWTYIVEQAGLLHDPA